MDKLVLKLNQRYYERFTIAHIKPYIKDINWDEYTASDLDEVLNYLYNSIKGTQKPPETLAIDSVFGISTFDEIKKRIEPNIVTSYLILDSKYQHKGYQASDGTFTFNYALTRASDVGIVSCTNDVKNIRSMTLLKPTIPSTKYTNFNHRNLSIVIMEMNQQSYFCATPGQRAHWIIKVSDVYMYDNVLNFDDEQFTCDYARNDKYNDKYTNKPNTFIFNFPIPRIERVTLTIGNCTQHIPFEHDTDVAIVTSYGNPITFTTSKPHKFTLPMYVTITSFTTSDVSADKWIIDTINSERAQLATIVGANRFSLAIDATSLTPIVGLQVNVYYEDRRVIVPLILEHD